MDNERAQWAAQMLTLLEPLKSRLTPGGSGFALGATAAHYETATIPMEAFSRPASGGFSTAPAGPASGRPTVRARYPLFCSLMLLR